MSDYLKKIARGQAPTEGDWNAHLVEAHQLNPGMTPRAFASYRTPDGLTSYEYLARSVGPADARVVDLACGDGYLVPLLLKNLGREATVLGVDMSAAELALAEKQASSRVSFSHCPARALPSPPGSVDQIVCHMAFMLMLPLEPVVEEIARVLRPGGKFSAIVSNPHAARGLYADILQITQGFVLDRYPAFKETRSGDKRVNSTTGIQAIFQPALGFAKEIEFRDLELQVDTEPGGLWNLMRDMYVVGMLPLAQKEEYQAGLLRFANQAAGPDGRVKFGFPMRYFSVTRT